MKLQREALVALLACLLAGCTSGGSASIEKRLQQMTLREKVGMMFIVRPESLEPDSCYYAVVLHGTGAQAVTEQMKEKAAQYPMGGVILFSENIHDPAQLKAFTADLKALPSHPLLFVDEEGGRVCRLAGNPAFGLPHYPDMGQLAGSGRTKDVYEAAHTMGTYLKEYGFDVNLAPVADVNTNPHNTVIGTRAFSNDPDVAASMVKSFVKGMLKTGMKCCLKHFPGHGDTTADSNYGYAMSRKNWEEIAECELIPFQAGIRAGVPMVMMAHIALPNVTGSNTPASLTAKFLQEKLRGELGFKGVVMTDSMEMGAILRQYSLEDACIMAIKAGVDMLHCVWFYPQVFDAVVAAVRRGEIPESRIDESVRRILILRGGK